MTTTVLPIVLNQIKGQFFNTQLHMYQVTKLCYIINFLCFINAITGLILQKACQGI